MCSHFPDYGSLPMAYWTWWIIQAYESWQAAKGARDEVIQLEENEQDLQHGEENLVSHLERRGRSCCPQTLILAYINI